MRFAALMIVLLFACGLSARGGDGGDYSGDGSSSSSSSGSDYGSSSSSSDYGSSDYGSSDYGGGGEAGPLELLFMLGFVVFVAGTIIYQSQMAQRKNRRLREQGLLNGPHRPDPLKDVLSVDPNFSPVLFRAFAHMIYVKYHESRGGMARRSKDDFAVAPYLRKDLRQRVQNSIAEIRQVIVGDMKVMHVSIGMAGTGIIVQFKSNVVSRGRNGQDVRMLHQEQFEFFRRTGVLTRAPEQALALGCPSCGSKQEPELSGRCPSCGSQVGGGEMDWQVLAIHGRSEKPVTGTVGQGDGVEIGTNYPTVMDPQLQAEQRALMARDPSFDWAAFRERTSTIFMKLQEGWTQRDESVLRPFELDHVFDTHRIWLERYREQRVRNVLKDITIDKWQAVKIEHDTWFDSITVRVFASMIDYNETEDGKLISGSPTKRKSFSEYHTYVRRTSFKPRSVADPLKCPQCGAPLDKISQQGICGYCDTRVTTGDFDWVLALITQDEEYGG